ncbi:hypothetical protein MK489_08690 [Myxococcota bacterium]|nr:hypothetical protein [Myxococcota bacterium]
MRHFANAIRTGNAFRGNQRRERAIACVASILLASCMGTASLTASLPPDIPILSGTRVLEASQVENGVTAKLRVAGEKMTVARTYRESLRTAGWRISAQKDTPTGETLIFADKASPPRSLSLMLTGEDNRTLVLLMETVH